MTLAAQNYANVRVEYEQDGKHYVYETQGQVEMAYEPHYETVYSDYTGLGHNYQTDVDVTMTVKCRPDAQGKYGTLKIGRRPKAGYRRWVGNV